MKYYNIIQLREELENKGFPFAYITVFSYVKKGYIKVSGFMPNGDRQVPVFTDKEVDSFIKIIPKLQKEGKIKLRVKPV